MKNFESIRLCRGEGSYQTRQACWMSAVGFYSGEYGPNHWGDHPECVCPAIRGLCIRINDMLPDDATRGRLIGPRLFDVVGTNGGPELAKRRAFLAADRACRVWAPEALDRIGLTEAAAKMRALPVIVDSGSAAYAKAYTAAYAAVYAAYASAYAAATAAYDAADAASYASYAAYAAAYDAAYASYAAERVVVERLFPLLDDMLAMGERRPVEQACADEALAALIRPQCAAAGYDCAP